MASELAQQIKNLTVISQLLVFKALAFRSHFSQIDNALVEINIIFTPVLPASEV